MGVDQTDLEAGQTSSERMSEDNYDALPYLSLPIAYTQPSQLAALSVLHGIKRPPNPERARVLELGTASGGNLLPLAARWPAAQFHGVDLSARQIADGNRRIKHFGLENVTLQQADLADLALPAQSFDYVICHGVFSWVPPAVQTAILRLIGHCLADDGVAAVSYNVWPGWHLRSPARDILRFYARSDGTVQERVSRARAALEVLRTCAGSGAYGALLRSEAQQLEKIPSSYILGEFLTENNHPVEFQDFIGSANEQGLEFICEADLDGAARAALSPEGRLRIDRLAQSSRKGASQELDLLSGRPFRRTLLRRRTSTPVSGLPSAAHLANLHIVASMHPDSKSTAAGKQSFTDRYGRPLSTRVASIGQALERLGQVYPATVPVDELLAKITSAERGRTAQALLDLVQSGRATISVLPVEVGRATDPRPTVWPFARAEAAIGLPGATSLHHVAVALSKIGAKVASMFDGTRELSEVTSWLAAEISAGRVVLPEDEIDASDADATARAANHVAGILRLLEESALLASSGVPLQQKS